ncbi:MAG: RNA chaperone Hfq [Oscillospiraceae bacterium]|jgi:host factor-I protein|nr:RNA chaperone Hfq [Oscillospiraceae bacterium]
MPNQKQFNLQDVFLNSARTTKQFVTVFLVNGFQMRGTVTGFDSFTVVLDSEGKQQLIYKHAISTIIPTRPVNFAEAAAAETDDK